MSLPRIPLDPPPAPIGCVDWLLVGLILFWIGASIGGALATSLVAS